jgi:hypothetical protein
VSVADQRGRKRVAENLSERKSSQHPSTGSG